MHTIKVPGSNPGLHFPAALVISPRLHLIQAVGAGDVFSTLKGDKR